MLTAPTRVATDRGRRPCLLLQSALAWTSGGALWLAAGLTAGGSLAALWIAADLLLLVGLLTLARLGLHGRTRGGRAGLVLAGGGRVVFLAAEALGVVEGQLQDALLPVASALSAVGMVLYGVGVLRAARWRGPGRFTPLVCGLYPFAVMFPLVAASSGEPSYPAIALWGATNVLLGAALLRPAAGSDASGAASR